MILASSPSNSLSPTQARTAPVSRVQSPRQSATHCIYIRARKSAYDARGIHLCHDFQLFMQTQAAAAAAAKHPHSAMLKQLTAHNTKLQPLIRTVKGYKLTGVPYSTQELQTLLNDVLLDPVAEHGSINQLSTLTALKADYYAESTLKPGITDNEAATLKTSCENYFGSASPPVAVTQFVSTTVYAFKFPHLDKILIEKPKLHTAIDELLREFLTRRIINLLVQDYSLLSHSALIQTKGFSRVSTPVPPPSISSSTAADMHTLNPPIPIASLSDSALKRLATTRSLHLSLAEFKAIQRHYAQIKIQRTRKKLGLPTAPTTAELEMLAQTWSEHCKHKIFNATIYYDDGKKVKRIRSLYQTYIKTLTAELQNERKDLLSVFHDNAGVFAFTAKWSIAVKVETHNTPAALAPFGGALTGIVGVNRDILGTGIGAKPLFNTNVFCLADPKAARGNLPVNVYHPQRMLSGVHRGIERGGNESGIPTVNGAMVFDERYLGRPLVFCGSGGLLERSIKGRSGVAKPIAVGDYIVTAGGRVGKDGIHGATASSGALTEASPTSIVQIGDPITQKKLSDFLMVAKTRYYYKTLTDNGAGGLASSVGELAQHTNGAQLHLQLVPLKYPQLAPWEILVSESQERMTLVVAPTQWRKLQKLAEQYDVEIARLGEFTRTGVFEAFYLNKHVVHLPLAFLHNGVPTLMLEAKFTPAPLHAQSQIPAAAAATIPTALFPAALQQKLRTTKTPTQTLSSSFLPVLKAMLARPNIASKESWVRRYDHEVKARTVIKPFDGADGHGANDAAVIRPLLNHNKGLAIACGIVPRYGEAVQTPDAYAMTAGAIDEAVRNLTAVGADPASWVGLDNFAWPDPLPSPAVPDSAAKLGQLVRSAEALYEICRQYKLPLISGKDSMKNDTVLRSPSGKRKRISIPPTLLFTALATLPNIATALSAAFKQAGSLIYIAGMTYPECGCSEYSGLLDHWQQQVKLEMPPNGDGDAAAAFTAATRWQRSWQTLNVPIVRPASNLALYQNIYQATQERLLLSAHDLSDGGLLVALSECAFGGMVSTHLDLNSVPFKTFPPAKSSAKSSAKGSAKETLPHKPDFHTLAYSESHGRFIFEVAPSSKQRLEALFAASNVPLTLRCVGETRADTSKQNSAPRLSVRWHGQTFTAALASLRKVWSNALAF